MDNLWQRTLTDLDEGNFTALETALGGPEGFDSKIVQWHAEERFNDLPEMLAEAFDCACMLGRTETARYLLDNGVDPYAGMRTWLAGPHWAASSGRVETMKMLLDRNIPLEVENKYGGTVLGQALWSACNEHTESHAEIIERLIDAGANVWPGTHRWWLEQDVPSEETKTRVAAAIAAKDPDEQ